MKNISILISLYFLFAISFYSNAGEIEVHTELKDSTGDTKRDFINHVIKIESLNSTDHKVYLEFNENLGEFQKVVQMTLENVPNGYFYHALYALIPFYKEQKKLNFLLYAHNFKPGKDKYVRELHMVNPQNLSGENLFRYYAKSRIQAKYVTENIDPTSRISRNNVRAIFHFLQSVREISYKCNIEPDSLSEKAYLWLQSSYKENKNLINNAVGKGQAPLLLKQYKTLKAENYSRLYRNTLDLFTVNFDAYCSIFNNLQSALLSLSDHELATINTEKKLMPHVAIAYSQCLWRAAKGIGYKNAFEGKNRDDIIRAQILILDKQIEVADQNEQLNFQIKAHKHDLEQLLK